MKFPYSIDNEVHKKNFIAIVSTFEGCVDSRDEFEFNSMYLLGADTKELLLEKIEAMTWEEFDSGYVWSQRHWGGSPDYSIQCKVDKETGEKTSYLELVEYSPENEGDVTGLVSNACKLREKGHLPSLDIITPGRWIDVTM